LFFMTSFSPLEAILSSFNWSENSRAGQYCVAGIWRTLTGADGSETRTMAMITVNAEGHAIMSRMHKPGGEKRSVVIFRPDDWEEWLSTPNFEVARAMLQLYSADEMVAFPK
ncbi:SOS response-associated peptidase family protein, partial [Burkholderia pseudomallei]